MKTSCAALVALAILLPWAVNPLQAQEVPVKDDPLVRMPGSQPAPEGGVGLEAPGRCLNCHGGYNTSVEPGFNWKGSMMAQAARDFLFWACMTTAAQDSQWAIGRKNATDLCLRCHFPKGWVEGRSDPTNATAMAGADFDGVQCDLCHTAFDPHYETTFSGEREGNDWSGYWDETNASGTPSDAAALETRVEDASQAAGVLRLNGEPFFSGDLPPAGYQENASGQYFLSTEAQKRASFSDAAARHQMFYSRYHKSKYFCATCHDVSNPILANLLLGGVEPGETRADFPPGRTLWTEENSAASYFHVERTFSEFMLSAYGQQGGAPGLGPFDPAVFDTSLPGNHIGRCQDCHMRDVSGVACNKQGVPVRPGESVEHPQSGQPLHDLTGGNVWVSRVLASAIAGSPNYDPVNDELLNQGPAVLTLDLTQGEGIDPVALLAGSDRAAQQLELAASVENLSYDAATGTVSFRIQNQSGHKLISGFPEGRRMFVNIRAYDAAGTLIHEVNPYDAAAGTLKGLAYPYQPDPNGALPAPAPLAGGEAYVDELVYEMHPQSSLTGENESFHFALATDRYKDNRIPPQGFDIARAAERLTQPRWHGEDAPAYFSAAEYAGGYDDVALTIAPGAAAVEVNLYYQTTSREYMEFLRDEINGNPANLTLPEGAYIAQTDPFFDRLRAWGDTIWNLWTHNMSAPGAAPYLMAQAAFGDTGGGCTAATPTLLDAVPAHSQVSLTWSDEHSGNPDVTGYNVYYDQAAKGQWVDQVGQTTTYTDTGLTNGQEYCYKVSSRTADCESEFSNVLCATPTNQTEGNAGVNLVETGYYSGKGKNRTFTLSTLFARGDQVVFRSYVVDAATGQPVEGAVVDLAITGPETHVVASGPSDANGMAEATWTTSAPNKRGQGGTAPGDYTATVANVTVGGYTWDGVGTAAGFTLQ